VRSLTIQQKLQDYILTARTKGLDLKTIARRHILPNISLPLITILGLSLPAAVGGSFVIESLFSIPGMGALTLDSYAARDYPVIFAILLLISFFTLLGTWLADLTYHLLDPRLKSRNR
jgi:peptide/nickel transport system permease protein